MRGGSDWLPLTSFRLRDQRVTVRAFSGHPSTGRASCSCGTSPVTRKASPSADIDRSDRVSMSPPSALRTDIRPVLRAISGAACRAILRGVGRVYLLNRDTLPLRFVGDEQRELGKAPGIGHAVVFAGGCPTTFACRALAYPLQGFYLDRAHAQGVGMVHDLPGKLVVDSFHPAGLFALAFPDSAKLLCLLQGFTAGVEATAHGPLRAPIAKEARAFAPICATAGTLMPRSTPMIADPELSGASSCVTVRSAIHLPRFFLMRKIPAFPSKATAAQRKRSCCVLPSLQIGRMSWSPSTRQF